MQPQLLTVEPRQATDDEPLDTDESADTATLSPVAARRKQFETMFQKSAPTLMSPTEFKRYEPGSLVKKRHSWLKDEIIENNKPLASTQKQKFKSPFLRRLMAKHEKQAADEDRDEDDIKHVLTSRDDAEEEEDQSPMKDTAAAIISPGLRTFQTEQDNDKEEEDEVDAKHEVNGNGSHKQDNISAVHQPHNESSTHQDSPTSTKQRGAMEGTEITISSSASGELKDETLNVSDLETDERGEDIAMTAFLRRLQQGAALRQQPQEDAIKPASSDKDEKIMAQDLVPAFSPKAADNSVKPATLTIAPGISNEYNDLQMMRIDHSQACEATCLEAVTCTIL
jgi:hypothetical protein